MQGYLDGHAAMALQNAAAHVNVLAASRHQEDNVHAKAFASKADKRTCWETTLRATQLQYMAQLGFTSSSEFFAWVVECNASRDGAVVEGPNRTPALAEKALAKERRCHETATQEKALAGEANEQRRAAAQEKALVDKANEQRWAVARDKVLADKANKQRRAAAQEKTLADEANERRRAAAQDKALANKANERRQVVAQEKALADEANKQRQAAAWDKALADEANKQRHHKLAKRATTLATKALAKDKHKKDNNNVARQFEAYAAPLFARVDAVMAKIRAMDDSFGNWAAFGDDILAKEDNKTSALMMPPSTPLTAVLPTPHRPTTYKDAVLSTMGGSLCAKSLVVAPLSCPSTTINDQLQTACHRSQPRCRVGRRHGPRAPNPQEHLLCGRRHRPRTPD